MTQEVPDGQPSAQPPPGWPYGDPPPPSTGTEPASSKPPPARGWWFLGVGLIVAAVVTLLFFIALAVRQGVTVFNGAVDVRVPGQSQVDVPAGEERMLYARPGATPSCTVADLDGTPLPLDPTSGSVSISINGDEWVGVGTFATGTGHVLVTCEGADGVVRVAHVFGGASFVVAILLAVFAPILLAFAGATVLTVTGVRHQRHRQRRR